MNTGNEEMLEVGVSLLANSMVLRDDPALVPKSIGQAAHIRHSDCDSQHFPIEHVE